MNSFIIELIRSFKIHIRFKSNIYSIEMAKCQHKQFVKPKSLFVIIFYLYILW